MHVVEAKQWAFKPVTSCKPERKKHKQTYILGKIASLFVVFTIFFRIIIKLVSILFMYELGVGWTW